MEAVDKKYYEMEKTKAKRARRAPLQTKRHETRETTPKWVRAVRLLRNATDIGPGDTFERIVAKFGADRVVNWLKTLGLKDCGCKARKARWNKAWPYKKG